MPRRSPRKGSPSASSPRRRRSGSAAGRESAEKTDGEASGAAAAAAASADAASAKLLADKPDKWAGWWRRFYATWLMLGSFVFIVWLGHMPLTLLVLVAQFFMYRELVSLCHVVAQEERLPGFRYLYWLWYWSAQYFCYTRTYYQLFPSAAQHFPSLMRYNGAICFALYTVGFVGFVLSLKQGFLMYQFKAYAFAHLAIWFVVLQGSVLVVLIHSGLLFFLLPVLLVVCNDVMAYFFGFFFGRTPLIKLSPNKTWEGFLGAAASTVVVGFFLPRFLGQYELMICANHNFFSMEHPTCAPQWHFIPAPYELPAVFHAVGLHFVTVSPVQYYGVALALFASLVSPFGGFFASAVKRMLKVKDFSAALGPHGGATDRLDCQIINGMFAYVILTTFIASASDVTNAMWHLQHLTEEQQLQVFVQLRAMLGK